MAGEKKNINKSKRKSPDKRSEQKRLPQPEPKKRRDGNDLPERQTPTEENSSQKDHDQLSEMVKEVTKLARETNEMVEGTRKTIEHVTDPIMKLDALSEYARNPLVRLNYEKIVQMVQICSQILDKTNSKVLPPSQAEKPTGSGNTDLGLFEKRVGFPPWPPTVPYYELHLNSITTDIVDPAGMARKALEKADTQIARIEALGTQATIAFMTWAEADQALKNLNQWTERGKSLKDLFDIKLRVKSPYRVRTSSFSSNARSKIKYLQGNKIDQATARNTLRQKNSRLFQSPTQIELVEMNSVGESEGRKYNMDIWLARDTYIDLAGRVNPVTLDTSVSCLTLHLVPRSTDCFRCLKDGHVARDCKEREPRCRYCIDQGEKHESNACPAKRQGKPSRCIDCYDSNFTRAANDKKLDDRHTALTSKCSVWRKRKAEETEKIKQAARSESSGRVIDTGLEHVSDAKEDKSRDDKHSQHEK